MDLTVVWKIQYGMFIVSSVKDGELNGQIANTVFQVTAEPPKIAISINKQNLTNEYITESGVFTVSILSEDAPMTFMGKFGFKSGRDINKFEDTKYRLGDNTGAPIIEEYALGYIECKVVESVDVGTHTMFIGEILDCDNLDVQGKPMTYAFYHQIKGGKTPKTATHYIDEKKNKTEEKSKEPKMDKYVCTVCGYVYDPAEGDPDNGIEPGTSFENIPDDWECPVCGVGKDSFEKE